MARASLYHDMRAVKPGDVGPIKIKYYHNGKTIMLPTTVKVLPEQWTGKKITNHPRAKQWNSLLDMRLIDISSEILELDISGQLQSLSAAGLKKKLLAKIGYEIEDDTNTFLSIFNEYVSRFDKPGTISIWHNTLNRISAYCSDAGHDLNRLKFEDITVEWLESFDSFLAKTAPKPNARAINHRNIRAVFNYAIKRKKMSISYPFADYKIKHQETQHIDLTIDQTRLLADFPISEAHISKFRDIFLLMIYLRGINAADLFSAKKTQIIDGRLEYYRCKTGAYTSVKIEPEAMAILNKYSGENYLLDIAEKWQDPKNYLRQMDKGLKKIGPVTYGKHGKKTYHGLFQRISSNSARHTWGSLIYELGYPIEIASDGFTHKHGYRTTNIYINRRNRERVDMANRDLIDYIANKLT